jgi:hypothetical protein
VLNDLERGRASLNTKTEGLSNSKGKRSKDKLKQSRAVNNQVRLNRKGEAGRSQYRIVSA